MNVPFLEVISGKPRRASSVGEFDALIGQLQASADSPNARVVYITNYLANACPTREEQNERLAALLASSLLAPAEVALLLQKRAASGGAAAMGEVRDVFLGQAMQAGELPMADAMRFLRGSEEGSAEGGDDGGDGDSGDEEGGGGGGGTRANRPRSAGRDFDKVVRSFCRSGKPPTAPAIRSLLDTTLLLIMLLLGFTQTNYRMVGTDALLAADKRWAGWCANATLAPFLTEHDWCLEPPSHTLFKRSTWSFSVLAMSLVVAVTTFVSMNWAELGKVDDAARSRWWLAFRWPIFAAIALLAAGLFFYCWTNSIAVRVIYVDIDAVLADPGDLIWTAMQNYEWAILAVFLASALLHVVMSGGWNAWLLRRKRAKQQVGPTSA